MKREIATLEDIKFLVDTFYAKVRQDELIGVIFNKVIGDKWAVHLEKMYSFWQTLLLGDHTYYGSPFAPHAKLPLHQEHFDRWLQLFNRTMDEHFVGEKAEEAKWRAHKMAEMFHYKIQFLREKGADYLN